MVGFLIGLFVGGFIGIVVMACCSMASKADRDEEKMSSQDKKPTESDHE